MRYATVCCAVIPCFCLYAAGRSLRGLLPEATPKVFFLFMAADDLPHERIWERFFASGRRGVDFHAFVHCQNRSRCERSFQSTGLFRLVDTVNSQWCEDLVGPMNTLLDTALKEPGGHPNDKFAFVSDSTVPVKPFATVLHRLVVDDGEKSNFCVSPTSMWGLHKRGDLALKHDQWLTLSREHAISVVSQYAGSSFIDELTPVQVTGIAWVERLINLYTDLSPSHFGLHVPGCLDEYVYFRLAFGLVNSSANAAADFLNMNGGPVLLRGEAAHTWQGRCDTYVLWGRGGNFSTVTATLDKDPLTVYVHKDERLHPAEFFQLSRLALNALRESAFLFARKVSKDATFADSGAPLVQAFEDYVFNPGSA